MGAACGTRIRRRRQELGLTQVELAEKIGLSETAIRSYELGNRNPKDGHRKVIAKALKVSPDYLREHDDYDESGYALPHEDRRAWLYQADFDRRCCLTLCPCKRTLKMAPGMG